MSLTDMLTLRSCEGCTHLDQQNLLQRVSASAGLVWHVFREASAELRDEACLVRSVSRRCAARRQRAVHALTAHTATQ